MGTMRKSETRTKEVRVLLGPQEKERIERAARARHRTTSDYLRTLALEDITADAVRQYAAGTVSQGTAASLAGLSRAEFLDELSRRGVSASQATLEEIRSEIHRDPRVDAKHEPGEERIQPHPPSEPLPSPVSALAETKSEVPAPPSRGMPGAHGDTDKSEPE